MTNLPPAMSNLPINPLTSYQKTTIQTTMLDAQANLSPDLSNKPSNKQQSSDQVNLCNNPRNGSRNGNGSSEHDQCFIDGHCLTQLTAIIRELEMGLLTPPHCQQRSFINQVLDDEFHEYQKTGKRVDKAMAIQWIMNSANNYHWRFSDFSVTALSNDQVVAHYFAYQHDRETKRCKRSRHSSIWRYQQARWQLFYHHANSLAIVTNPS